MENKFIDGLFAKAPHERAPDFIKARLSIKPQQFAQWLQQNMDQEWINLDVKVSKDGKWYCAINDYKPEGKEDPLAPAREALYPEVQYPEPQEEQIKLEDVPF